MKKLSKAQVRLLKDAYNTGGRIVAYRAEVSSARVLQRLGLGKVWESGMGQHTFEISEQGITVVEDMDQ